MEKGKTILRSFVLIPGEDGSRECRESPFEDNSRNKEFNLKTGKLFYNEEVNSLC